MNVKAIRAALAAAVDGVQAGGKRVEARGRVFTGDPPFAYPADTAGSYHEDMDGSDSLAIGLRILTSMGEDQSGQELLDEVLSDTGTPSVMAAIEADPTLGGLVRDVTVTGFDGYRTFEVAGTEYYGAELDVVILL